MISLVTFIFKRPLFYYSMNINLDWQKVFSKYEDYVFVVEGKKDALALHALGFEKVYTLNKTGVSLRERIEEIVNSIYRKDTVCILTDFDKKGKQLYITIKMEMQNLGIRLDRSFRGLLLRMKVSHIEGLNSFIENGNLEDQFI